jgi:hypothetical protein
MDAETFCSAKWWLGRSSDDDCLSAGSSTNLEDEGRRS